MCDRGIFSAKFQKTTKDRNMALKTGKEYLDSLKSLDLEANILGQKTGDLPGHRLVEPSQKAVAFTYDSAGNPETRELFCAESSLSNDTVNRFTHLHQRWAWMPPMPSTAPHLNATKNTALITTSVLEIIGSGCSSRTWWWTGP
jgi:hypothetical protein